MDYGISKLRVKRFQAKLLAWYSSNGRKFLWRCEDRNEYEIIIAEVLLQRTKAETIERFYQNFIDKYPNWKTITETPLDAIEIDLKPIGLYKQRAKRIINLAIELNKRNGVVPESRGELEKIPMFGQYIANAIELQLFSRNKPLLDVNMARVLERYFGPRKLSDIRYDPYLQKLSHEVANHKNSKQINWAILDFAALVCKSRKPLCSICLLSTSCNYYRLFANK